MMLVVEICILIKETLVTNVNTEMLPGAEENTYCNEAAKMLYLAIKSLLPLGVQDMENELYNFSETNKDFLQN
eukprot:4778734-Ditylum_brightwellii.AAC.1